MPKDLGQLQHTQRHLDVEAAVDAYRHQAYVAQLVAMNNSIFVFAQGTDERPDDGMLLVPWLASLKEVGEPRHRVPSGLHGVQ